MKKEILVNVDQEDVRVAIMENDVLVELYVERPLAQRLEGNIYKGKVENVLPGMEACFVDLDLERNGFLYVDDAHPALPDEVPKKPKGRNPAISQLVQPGQEIMVQIVKEPGGSKGARVTRQVTLPGRYFVLMPVVDYVGVSRRIADESERKRLREMAFELKPEGYGLIVRTVAEGKKKKELEDDVQFLLKQWREIEKKNENVKAPALLYRDQGLSYQVLRDCFDQEVNTVWVDDQTEFEKILGLLNVMAPRMKKRVKKYRGHLFDDRGLEREIEKAVERRAWLKCGGYLIIDRTEALTSIDVNTGRYVGADELEKTVFKTNLEAAQEIGRQLRLRDIGGIIIIDFIDMESSRHRKRVVKELEKVLARDKTKATVLGLTQLGLVEMTRKKGKQSLDEYLLKPCPYCEGSGRVMSEQTMSRRVRNEIKRTFEGSQAEAVLVEVHPSVAAVLIGAGGSNLRKIEQDLGRSVYVRGAESCHMEEMKVIASGGRSEVEDQALPVQEGEIREVLVEEAHVANEKDGIARVEGYVLDIESGGKYVGKRVQVEIIKTFRTYAKAKLC